MENVNTQQTPSTRSVDKARIKELVSRLASTAGIIKENIEKNTEKTIWPYAESLKSRLQTVCVTVLGPNNSEMETVDMLSALFTIEHDVVLAGWSEDITGKIADALTFTDDFDTNEAIVMYLFDLSSFVAHSFEMKSFIESNEDDEIKALQEEFNVVADVIEAISSKC